MKTPVPMNLPYCYYLFDKIRDASIPAVVREQAIESWAKYYDAPKVDPPPGWSRDWRRHKAIHNWVLPFRRWHTLAVDQSFHMNEMWNRRLYSLLGCCGDIVPIMYCEERHDFVIFKTAQRLYFFNKAPNTEDDINRIIALPYSENDLSNPAVLDAIYKHRWDLTGALYGRGNANAELLSVNDKYLKLLEFLKTEEGRLELKRRSLTVDPTTWPLEDRNDIDWLVRRIWRGSRKPMNKPEADGHW